MIVYIQPVYKGRFLYIYWVCYSFFTLNDQKVQQQLDLIVKAFETPESLPKILSHAYIEFPGKHMASWSVSNQFLTLLNHLETHEADFANCNCTIEAMGFSQWKAKGRYVKAGEKAFAILAPIFAFKCKGEFCKQFIFNSQKQLDQHLSTHVSKPAYYRFIIGFNAVPVFQLQQTDGKPLPTFVPKGLPDIGRLAESVGIKVSYKNLGRAYGATVPDASEIKMATEEEQVFAHELIHAYQQKVFGDLKGGQHLEQEVIAELGSCVLMQLYGKQADLKWSLDYIAGYVEAAKGKSDTQTIAKVCISITDKLGKIILAILKDGEKIGLTVSPN